MTAMQATTPLAHVEALFQKDHIRFSRQNNGTIWTRVESEWPFETPIKYSIGFSGDENALVGMVMFGLPLEKESLAELTAYLTLLISDVTFGYRHVPRILMICDQIRIGHVNKDVVSHRNASDAIYPLIMRISEERRWIEPLVQLALLPVTRMNEQ